jgi:hypothetical protein
MLDDSISKEYANVILQVFPSWWLKAYFMWAFFYTIYWQKFFFVYNTNVFCII